MKRATDITFIIGPPGPDEEKRKLEGWSKKSGKSTSEIWVEYVHEVLGNFVKCDPGQTTSKFDELISKVVNTPVQVRDPFLTYTFQSGGRVPGIILYVGKITLPNGKPPQIDWTDARIRESIGSVLGLIFKAEWVRSLVAYG
jgi:hypothetical protein